MQIGAKRVANRIAKTGAAICLALVLAACDAGPLETLFGMEVPGDPRHMPSEALWQASLETLSFMTLQQARRQEGKIVSTWYQPPETPGYRLKVSVNILGPEKKAENLQVRVDQQRYQYAPGNYGYGGYGANGQWVEAPVNPSTAASLKATILARAAYYSNEAGDDEDNERRGVRAPHRVE